MNKTHKDMRTDVCIQISIDTCMDTYAVMCIYSCTDLRISAYIVMIVDKMTWMYVHISVYGSVCRHVYRQV